LAIAQSVIGQSAIFIAILYMYGYFYLSGYYGHFGIRSYMVGIDPPEVLVRGGILAQALSLFAAMMAAFLLISYILLFKATITPSTAWRVTTKLIWAIVTFLALMGIVVLLAPKALRIGLGGMAALVSTTFAYIGLYLVYRAERLPEWFQSTFSRLLPYIVASYFIPAFAFTTQAGYGLGEFDASRASVSNLAPSLAPLGAAGRERESAL
jgi:hypothetical protein